MWKTKKKENKPYAVRADGLWPDVCVMVPPVREFPATAAAPAGLIRHVPKSFDLTQHVNFKDKVWPVPQRESIVCAVAYLTLIWKGGQQQHLESTKHIFTFQTLCRV